MKLPPLLATLVALVLGHCSPLLASPSLSAPPGFAVTLFADDDLAHDIFALTINAGGEVVVSGPGYVRVLLDEDQDGQAETFRTFASSPATGAQGLFFDGTDLLCTGDGGLLRYRDQDGDGQADGPPEQLLALRTGGEHFAHAVQRGPDGWWYLLLGNLAGIDHTQVNLRTSPVLKPQAGVLMRIAPDFSATEVIADGFRNPYDFDFHAGGAILTFDSDGERDVSLPWYRPTRVFQILPGTHAGWVTASWKHPDYFPDMPPIVASCGRGSPTGVACYRHTRFPRAYHDALFILDWTFGRVSCVHLAPQGASLSGTVQPFLAAQGQFGFAPTDIAVTPDGDLMISVGGRGTRGGVYRVRYVGQPDSTSAPAEAEGDLTRCLSAPQPLSSWSRTRWMPLARQLGKTQLLAAAHDTRRPIAQRMRALEIVVELFPPLDPDRGAALAADPSPAVRARVAWALGRQAWDNAVTQTVAGLLQDEDPLVASAALQATARNLPVTEPSTWTPLLAGIARQLSSADSFTWQAAWKAVARMSVHQQLQLTEHLADAPARARIAYTLAVTDRRTACNPPAFELAWKAYRQASDGQLKLAALRAAQKALGDAGPVDGQADVFDGYAAPALHPQSTVLATPDWSRVELPTGDRFVDLELIRLIAMLVPDDPAVAERLCDLLDNNVGPLDEAHCLIALARLPGPLSTAQRSRAAAVLVQLESRLQRLGLQQDRNWDLRIAEAFEELGRKTPALIEDVIRHPEFGQPGHVMFTRCANESLRAAAAQRVADYLLENPDVSWTNDVVFLLCHAPHTAHRELVRQQFDNPALRGAVIEALAEQPEEGDRSRFVSGLQSPDLAVVQAAVKAFERLSVSRDAEELFALLNLMRRLGADRQERAVRDRAVGLLRRATGREFGYVANRNDSTPPTEAIAGWTEYLRQQYPEQAARHLQSAAEQTAQLMTRLAAVNWSEGSAQRGKAVFERQTCLSCHGARAAVGPDLTGVGARFSRHDLFTAMVYPNQDVSPRYTTTLIETTRGTMVSGLVIYESVDGVTLLDSTNQTLRVEADEIEARYELPTSLMPAGLLDNLSPQDLADLYAYLCEL